MLRVWDLPTSTRQIPSALFKQGLETSRLICRVAGVGGGNPWAGEGGVCALAGCAAVACSVAALPCTAGCSALFGCMLSAVAGAGCAALP